MADSIEPTHRIPQPGEGQTDPRQRRRRSRSRSPFRADYSEDADGDRIDLSEDAGRQLENVESAFRALPSSSTLDPEHWRSNPPRTEGKPAALPDKAALETGRALRDAAGGTGTAASPREPEEDRVSINAFGLPSRVLTGEVQTAVTSVMELLDSLREKLAAAEQRESELLARMERDEIPGLLNRSTLMRRLDDFLARSRTEGGAVFGALVYLESYVSVRQRGGIARANQALEQVAAQLPRFDDNPMYFSGTIGGSSLVVLGRAVEGEPVDEAFRAFAADLRSRLDRAFGPKDGGVLSTVLLMAGRNDYADQFLQRLDDTLRRTPFRSTFEPEDPFLNTH